MKAFHCLCCLLCLSQFSSVQDIHLVCMTFFAIRSQLELQGRGIYVFNVIFSVCFSFQIVLVHNPMFGRTLMETPSFFPGGSLVNALIF